MLKELSVVCIVTFILFSLRLGVVKAQCPLCGFRAAYWLRNELADLTCGACDSLSGNENIFADVDLLLNKSASMLKDGKPYLRGPVGNPGAVGHTGATGPTGSIGVQGPNGFPGVLGPQGDTGAFGPQGAKGLPGRPRLKRQINSANKESVRNKITSYLSNCSEVNDYFLSFAGEIDNMRANKVKRNLTKKAESQSVKKLIARYEQVSSLYEHVQILFDDVQKEVGADPRYKGMTGPTGREGFSGLAGRTGLVGPMGAPGAPGPKGPPGNPGPVGNTGNTGPTGM